jgi:hypothetical protein
VHISISCHTPPPIDNSITSLTYRKESPGILQCLHSLEMDLQELLEKVYDLLTGIDRTLCGFTDYSVVRCTEEYTANAMGSDLVLGSSLVIPFAGSSWARTLVLVSCKFPPCQ